MSRIQQEIKRPPIERIKDSQTQEVVRQLYDQLQQAHEQVRDSVNEAEKRIAVIHIEDLAAGADISSRPVFAAAGLKKIEITDIGILSQGTPAGIDNGNTCVVTVTDDAANQIVQKTYNGSTSFPDADYDSLGALNTTHKVLATTEHLLLSITNGATAAPPAMLVIVEYRHL